MSNVVFHKRTPGDTIYWLDLSGELSPESTYAIGYRITGSGIPDTLTLTQTWSTYTSGVYLFLKTTPTNISQFETNLTAFLGASGQSQVRFVWIKNPDEPYVQWRTYTLAAQQDNRNWMVARLTPFNLVSYELIIGGRCPIVLQAEPPAGLQAGFAFQRVSGLPDSLRFTSGSGMYTFVEQSGQVFLSLSGKSAGTFAFQIKLVANPTHPDQPLEQLDAGLRYFVDDTAFPGADLLRSFRYPVLAPTTDVMLYSLLDVVDPLDPTRSYFSLTHQTARLRTPCRPTGARSWGTRSHSRPINPRMDRAAHGWSSHHFRRESRRSTILRIT